MNNYISADLMGGLGNQMFQIAHAISQGEKHNRPVIFRPTSFTPMQGKNTSEYVKNIFRNVTFSNESIRYNSVFEKEFHYQEVEPFVTNTIFNGYYQSSKNFLGFDQKIKNIFSPPDSFISEVYEKYKLLQNDKTVSIHIRNGDYKKNSDIHPILTKMYIDKILKKVPFTDNIFLFGDDKEFLRENFSDENIILVEEEDWYEMWMMSLCKINIIANSTFSWWGAFLNKNPEKIVYSPSIWFGPRGPKNYQDIYETDWIKVETHFEDGKLL